MASTSGRIETSVSYSSKFYLAWQQTGQSTAGNYTDINWQAGLNLANGVAWYSSAVKINNIYIDGTKVFNGGTYSNISGNGDHQLTSGTRRIYHDADGEKNFIASISGWLYSYGDKNASGNWDLTTINRFASITSAPNFTDEDNPTITYSNPAGTAVTTLQVCIAEASGNRDIIVPYRDVSKTGTSYTFNLTTEERTALRNSTPNANTKTLAFYIRTVINGTESRPQTNRTLTIINANPVFSNFAYEDTNTVTTTLTGNNQKLVNGYSNVKATVSTANKAVAQKGASMVNYILIIGSKQITVAYSSSADVELNVTGVASGLIKLQAVDSRGNITELTNTADIISYISLVFSAVKFERQNGVGTTCTITGNGTYNNVNFGSLTNTITKVEYRKSVKNSGSWDSWVDITSKFTTSSGTFTNTTVGNTETGFTLGTEYEIEVRVIDRLMSQTLITTVNSGEALIAKNKTKKIVGFGKLPNTNLEKGSIDVAGSVNAKIYDFNTGIQTNIQKTSIGTVDTRDTNELPSYYYNLETGKYREFKEASVLGITGASGTFVQLETTVQWPDISGGSVIQEAKCNGQKWIRYSTSTSTWENWFLRANNVIEKTTEFETNDFVNNKRVYGKMFSVASFPNNTSSTIAHGLVNTAIQVVDIKFYGRNTAGTYQVAGIDAKIRFNIIPTNMINITTTDNFSTYSGYVIMYYYYI